jgi:hypothetical protein
MKLQIEMKNKPGHTSRLNGLLWGVALLWLVTSVLLLVLSAAASSQPHQKYEHKNDRTHSNAHHQLFARVEHQPAAPHFLY